MQSENINELAGALAAAQGKFPAILKDKVANIESQKGKYSYRYADLATVLEAVKPALAEQGLALVQPIEFVNGSLFVSTKLLHKSGQWIDSLYPLALQQRPQDMGSAITYARRYAASAILGIATEEDDDAAKASRKATTLSKEQVARLWEAAKLKAIDKDRFLLIVQEVAGTDSPAKIPAGKFDAILKAIEAAK